MVSGILRAAGYKVGTYTSPHMRHISERISTGQGTHMEPSAFDELVQRHWQVGMRSVSAVSLIGSMGARPCLFAMFGCRTSIISGHAVHAFMLHGVINTVAKSSLCQVLEECQKSEAGALSHFEAVTALAYK